SWKDACKVDKLTEALRARGVVTRIEWTHGTPELSFDDFESAGVSDASDAWAAPAPELDLAPTMETPVPADVPLVVPAAEPEPEWGFDEAQIETVRRAAEPPPPAPVPPPKKGGRWGAIMVVLVIALLGFGGWYFWYLRSAAVPAAGPAASRRRVVRPVPVL